MRIHDDDWIKQTKMVLASDLVAFIVKECRLFYTLIILISLIGTNTGMRGM